MNIDQLQDRYGIKNRINFKTGAGGFPYIQVQNQSASSLISLYGGQILSFKPVDQHEDLLFVSTKSLYQAGMAIRGGIPVCWPWFGPDPKGLHRPNHGFVRNQFWTVAASASSDSETRIQLQFSEKHKTERTWQLPFTLTLEFNIGKSLALKLTTQNTGDRPFSLTQAFHSYFSIGDIRQVQVLGLENAFYFDKLDQGREKRQTGIVTISEETDRIYENINSHLVLNDPVFKRRVEIDSENCKTGVVWNPWQKAMADLHSQAYRRFVCVETGNIAFDVVQIFPGEQKSLLTTYKVLSSQ
ncbi:MAG: D-hexose-6-phosphate mutarotase [Gammaproteobacteria bacterium]